MKKSYVPFLVILGLIFAALAIYYWVTPAGSLPSAFPGHEAGSTHHHFKHGLGALILAIGCFVWAWFAGGAKPTAEQNTEKK